MAERNDMEAETGQLEKSDSLYEIQARIYSELRDAAEFLGFLDNMLWHEESEDERRRIRALEHLYGDDIPTGADIEHAFETDGEDPRNPDIPYSPFRGTFARAANYSYIMLVCLIFEGECQNLLKAVAQWKGVEAIAIKHGVVSESRKFFETTLGASAIVPDAWDALERLMKVRNCIAHAGGIIGLDPKPNRRNQLESFVISAPGLSIETWLRHGEPMLVVEQEYCRSAVKTVEAVFEGLFSAIDEIAPD